MRTIIATTHADAQGTLTKEALEQIAAQDSGRLYPLSRNFDLRQPPAGHATILPEIEQLTDGCWALYAEIDLLPDANIKGVAIGYVAEPPTVHNISETDKPSDPHCVVG